ncbi:MAG: NUDIX hydrolase [Deltaproteobacteria bacterium]|nr:NUDIX hydrolase [Deltaproteobacteria bacterium]MBW2069289.1 NUDIX hydrolase [Deltaproteobacteria bacterium]
MYEKPWQVVATEVKELGGLFKVRKDRVIMPKNGREYNVYALCVADWVNVIPLTDDMQVVMVKQYRHGIRDFTLELPGGVIDSGDTPEGAARRELMEETGFVAEKFELLGTVFPNPAIQTNKCYTYLACDARKEKSQQLDEMEDIEVITIPLDLVADLIRKGEISHGLIMAAFCHLFVKKPKLLQLDRLDSFGK